MTTTTFAVDAKEFAYTLRRVAGFTSRDPKVHFLHWIRVFTRGGYVYVAATDRYRALIRRILPHHMEGQGFDILLHRADVAEYLQEMKQMPVASFSVTGEGRYALCSEGFDMSTRVIAPDALGFPDLHKLFKGLTPVKRTAEMVEFNGRWLKSLAAPRKGVVALYSTSKDGTGRYLFRADSDEIGLVMPVRFTVYESDVFAGWEWLQEGDE